MAFELNFQNDYVSLILKGECTGNEVPSVDEYALKEAKSRGIKNVIVQCGECGSVSTHFLRQLSQIFRGLKEINGKMCLVNVNEEIQNNIRKNGLDRILVSKISLRGALIEFGVVKAKDFDVAFINPFLNATQKVIKVQCSMEAIPQKPFVKQPNDPLLLGDISGIIGVTSETFNGTLAISFPEVLFVKLASNMLAQQFDKISDDIVDLAGELSNIILGQAKIELNTLGYRIQQAIPSCVWGKEHKIKHFGSSMCIVLPFKTPAGIFHVEVSSSQALLESKTTKG